jgi:hypothetical protein
MTQYEAVTTLCSSSMTSKIFFAQMVIVADSNRRAEFAAKLSYSAFNDIRHRVRFLDFVSLVKRYELVAAESDSEVQL